MIRTFLAIALFAVPCVARAAEAESDEWRTIHLAGQRVGYGHVTTRTVERDGRELVVTEDVTQMTIKRFGQTLVMRVEVTTTETPGGALVELRSVTRNPPAAPSRSTAIVDGRTLKLELETGGKKSQRTLDWEPGTKSPSWGPSGGDAWKPGDERTHETFLPELNRRAKVTTKAIGHERVELHDGSTKRLLKIVSSNDVVPGKTVTFLDDEGRELLSRIDVLGTEMVVHAVPRDVALEKIEGEELDLAVKTLIPVRGLQYAHGTKRVVYRIHAEGADPSDLFSRGFTQGIRSIDGNTIEVTVSAVDELPSGTDTAKDVYTNPSRFLQSDDPRVVAHARKAIEKIENPDREHWNVAVAMERYVRDELTAKNFSTAMASAAEVAEKLEGDCTEHAVLLAAMLRSQGVPSRIAVGLVYAESRRAFAGHMWTEVFVQGGWVPIDGTLARGGTRGGHLKMADSAFDDESGHPIAAFLPVLQSIGKLRIEVVEVK